MNLDLVTIIVDSYDEAIRFFVDVLGFALVEDTPSTTNDGRAKRWVVVRPPSSATGILLAQADGETQRAAIGQQMAGRVGFFLRVDDFDAAFARMRDKGVRFVSEPRAEPYGKVAVFLDLAGNRWDLLGPKLGSDALTKRIAGIFTEAAYMTHLGVAVVRVTPGECETRLVVRQEHTQQNGFVHAGVTAAMADHTAGAAAATLAPEGHGVLTTEYGIHLLRPARGKELRCVAKVLKPGRTLSVVESEVMADGVLVAKLTATLAIVPSTP